MSSEFEDLNSSAIPGRSGKAEKKADRFDSSFEIRFAWITALNIAWIATLVLSIATAWAYLP
jgi:hypothetical protein